MEKVCKILLYSCHFESNHLLLELYITGQLNLTQHHGHKLINQLLQINASAISFLGKIIILVNELDFLLISSS